MSSHKLGTYRCQTGYLPMSKEWTTRKETEPLLGFWSYDSIVLSAVLRLGGKRQHIDCHAHLHHSVVHCTDTLLYTLLFFVRIFCQL